MIHAVPNIKAAEKWALQSEKRALRNKNVKSRLKTLFKRAAESGDPAVGGPVESAFDKAAAKGIIHPNKAARKKARLAKTLQRSPAVSVKTTKPAKKRSTRKK